jgi:hypothetical protein
VVVTGELHLFTHSAGLRRALLQLMVRPSTSLAACLTLSAPDSGVLAESHPHCSGKGYAWANKVTVTLARLFWYPRHITTDLGQTTCVFSHHLLPIFALCIFVSHLMVPPGPCCARLNLLVVSVCLHLDIATPTKRRRLPNLPAPPLVNTFLPPGARFCRRLAY